MTGSDMVMKYIIFRQKKVQKEKKHKSVTWIETGKEAKLELSCARRFYRNEVVCFENGWLSTARRMTPLRRKDLALQAGNAHQNFGLAVPPAFFLVDDRR
jgi:hypothetical protein